MQSGIFRGGFIVAIGLVLVLCSGCCHLSERCGAENTTARYGWVIGLKADHVAEYKELHAAVWPKVLEQIKASHIRNYSIYLAELRPGEFYLFSYLEYTGNDFDSDMKRMADDSTTQTWWKVTKPCQTPIPTAQPGEWWSTLPEVFHLD